VNRDLIFSRAFQIPFWLQLGMILMEITKPARSQATDKKDNQGLVVKMNL
jgi:hypothetical protein